MLRLGVRGGPDPEVALWGWLREDPDLRGLIDRAPASVPEGAMGAATDIVVALGTTGTLTATVTAVARSVQVWLTHRHGDVTVTITAGELTITGDRVGAEDIDRLVRAAETARAALLPSASTPEVP